MRTVVITCPKGRSDLELKGQHAGMDDREFLEKKGLADENGDCPMCGTEPTVEWSAHD